MYLDDIERIALKGLCDNLAHSDVIAAYVDEYAARKRLKHAASQDHARFERRVGEIEREINRLVDSIVKGVPPETLAPRVRDLETERSTVRASLAAAKERDSVITIHPRHSRATRPPWPNWRRNWRAASPIRLPARLRRRR